MKSTTTLSSSIYGGGFKSYDQDDHHHHHHKNSQQKDYNSQYNNFHHWQHRSSFMRQINNIMYHIYCLFGLIILANICFIITSGFIYESKAKAFFSFDMIFY
ncbi:hypothetical protein DERF_005984 [Dermatophagoides farinae]|uniref:Uncharacterized protein n=1 Tax=Dermatophagoides farinae TaxID=6954 RepID=A0A922I6P6_DERFA|nr:hypothetical protein DERF_005984 [Dermatophagoides farinae]